MRTVKVLGIIGAGVIGAGWSARALHAGIDVIATDADPLMRDWLHQTVEYAQPSLEALTADIPMPPAGTLRFVRDPREVAEAADLIQENVPEQLAIKHAALIPISEAAPADVIIASSTSGIMPSAIQAPLSHPERLCVGHPFNPVYLCPLVEVVGGQQTAPETLRQASEFYRMIGMHTLVLKRELPGHVSDRLQEAMWREILHMVKEGEATTDELDQSLIYGPGLRWAIMGMNMVFHIAGGEAGMRHMLEHFGPTLQSPWTRLEAPELTADLIEKMVTGTQTQAAGRSIRELERIRDECLVAIQRVLRNHNIASGAALNAFERRMRNRIGEEHPSERDLKP